jgi:hypothetical protein
MSDCRSRDAVEKRPFEPLLGSNTAGGEVALRGDVLRQERSIAAVEVDVDRINARLGLSDTPQ